MNSRRSWVIFGIGVFAYLVAVMQRTSIGVAGVAATGGESDAPLVMSSATTARLVEIDRLFQEASAPAASRRSDRGPARPMRQTGLADLTPATGRLVSVGR